MNFGVFGFILLFGGALGGLFFDFQANEAKSSKASLEIDAYIAASKNGGRYRTDDVVGLRRAEADIEELKLFRTISIGVLLLGGAVLISAKLVDEKPKSKADEN